jgi:hypothetical protein
MNNNEENNQNLLEKLQSDQQEPGVSDNKSKIK